MKVILVHPISVIQCHSLHQINHQIPIIYSSRPRLVRQVYMNSQTAYPRSWKHGKKVILSHHNSSSTSSDTIFDFFITLAREWIVKRAPSRVMSRWHSTKAIVMVVVAGGLVVLHHCMYTSLSVESMRQNNGHCPTPKSMCLVWKVESKLGD
jgi:hypothetical protein